MVRTLAFFVLSWIAFLPARGDETNLDKISDIMIQAHLRPENRGTRNNLDSKVIDGKATAAERQELLDLYTKLSKATPPSGDFKDWGKRTSEMVAAVKAVMRGEEKAGERLTAARDCKACHILHRSGN